MSRQRPNLTALLSPPPDPEPEEVAPPAPEPVPEPVAAPEPVPAAEPEPARPAAAPRARAPRPRRTPAPAPARPAPVGEGPRYERLQRKEARLEPDDADRLDLMARRLDRARQAARKASGDPALDERITANTLVRVATLLLLEHEGHLSGLTEGQLLDSLRDLASS